MKKPWAKYWAPIPVIAVFIILNSFQIWGLKPSSIEIAMTWILTFVLIYYFVSMISLRVFGEKFEQTEEITINQPPKSNHGLYILFCSIFLPLFPIAVFYRHLNPLSPEITHLALRILIDWIAFWVIILASFTLWVFLLSEKKGQKQ